MRPMIRRTAARGRVGMRVPLCGCWSRGGGARTDEAVEPVVARLFDQPLHSAVVRVDLGLRRVDAALEVVEKVALPGRSTPPVVEAGARPRRRRACRLSSSWICVPIFFNVPMDCESWLSDWSCCRMIWSCCCITAALLEGPAAPAAGGRG